jgi:hypothetical protein
MEKPRVRGVRRRNDVGGADDPVYPATAGSDNADPAGGESGGRWARRTVSDPSRKRRAGKERFPPIADAIRAYHYPENVAGAEAARQRLALGEFVAVQGGGVDAAGRVAGRQRRTEVALEAESRGFPFGSGRSV